MWQLDYKERGVLKKWCFWTVVLEKTLESPLDCKEIKAVNPKGNQSWIFIGRTDDETKISILWPPDAKNWLHEKDPDARKDWRWEEKETTEGEMVGWHHWLDGHKFEQALGVGDGQGGLVCCSPWGHKESDTTEWLNWTDGCWYYCGYGSHRDSMAILHNMANCRLVLEDPMNVDSRASFLSTLCLLFNSLKTHVL